MQRLGGSSLRDTSVSVLMSSYHAYSLCYVNKHYYKKTRIAKVSEPEVAIEITYIVRFKVAVFFIFKLDPVIVVTKHHI